MREREIILKRIQHIICGSSFDLRKIRSARVIHQILIGLYNSLYYTQLYTLLLCLLWLKGYRYLVFIASTLKSNLNFGSSSFWMFSCSSSTAENFDIELSFLPFGEESFPNLFSSWWWWWWPFASSLPEWISDSFASSEEVFFSGFGSSPSAFCSLVSEGSFVFFSLAMIVNVSTTRLEK